ncbi:MAG TPA: VIT domain-containing protein [candidate division Zixibacteria bacterium]|nr:VIT domain-containing protein [candidate division Zixibacteria bacterium]
MKKRFLFPLMFLTLLFAAVLPAEAQRPEPIPPMPPVWNFEGLKIEYQRVNTMIEDQVATTHIDQLFVNDNDWMLEGVYLFPLPAGATVSELTMWVNGVAIEAKILEAGEARQIYDEIVRQWRDPALLEYVGSSAIQANVFPIPPNDERRIEIEYSQILPAENGLIHYVYPQSTNLYTNTPLENQNLRVEVNSDEAIRTIYSPSHQVSIDRDGDFRAVVGYEGINVTPDEDFEVYYSVSQEDIGLNLISFKESGQDGFFLLLVAPAVDVDLDEVVAKDVILVIDTSGSMEGDKLFQAKKAASFVIDHLNERDRFNIVSFSTGVRTFARDLIPVSDAGNYERFIDNLEALGGTNISQALLDGVAQADDDRPTTIIFLTDGLATEGIVETPFILDAVKQQAPGNVRLFAFGVGDDVDTLLLDSLTEEHGGATTYVRPGQQIDEAVSGFYAKVSTPVLADISIDFDDIMVEQLYPQELPDLFAGTQLVLAGRYRDGGPATITLTGEVNGREQTFIFEDNQFRRQGGDDFIPRLWATRAIGNLLSQIRLHGEEPELVQSVVNLSVRYGIITPYTSYLIEEDDIFSQTSRRTMFEETMDFFTAPAEVSGAQAVEEAAAESVMKEAEVFAMPTMSIFSADGDMISADEVIQLVGSKTFVLRDGVWMDTAYDADGQSRQQVGFASDVYFDLVSAAPELGQYLALGPKVLVVHQGEAYEIVDGDGQDSITMPEVAPTNEIDGDGPDSQDKDKDSSQDGKENKPALNICGAALMIPLILAGVLMLISRRMIP